MRRRISGLLTLIILNKLTNLVWFKTHVTLFTGYSQKLPGEIDHPYRHSFSPSTAMLSKTPLPRMSLCLQESDTQKHPGLPDMPRSRRSTQEVQAEKAEKVALREEKGRLRSETIQATAELETCMEAQLKQKLTMAH